MNFEDLKDPELQEKMKSAKTPEELLALAREQGYELSNDELEGIGGGSLWGCENDCSKYVPEPKNQTVSITGDNNYV